MTHADDGIVMIVSPTDRYGDADRLTEAGFRVIATSQGRSTVQQILDANPAVVVVELVPAFAAETIGFLTRLAGPGRRRRISLVVYGEQASQTDHAALDAIGARWVQLGPSDRGALAAVCEETRR